MFICKQIVSYASLIAPIMYSIGSWWHWWQCYRICKQMAAVDGTRYFNIRRSWSLISFSMGKYFEINSHWSNHQADPYEVENGPPWWLNPTWNILNAYLSAKKKTRGSYGTDIDLLSLRCRIVGWCGCCYLTCWLTQVFQSAVDNRRSAMQPAL